MPPRELVARARALPRPILTTGQRLVFHLHTAPETIADLAALIGQLKAEKAAAGFSPAANASAALHSPATRIYLPPQSARREA